MIAAQPRVVVSGANGYLGSALVPHLAQAGWEVHALVRSESRVAKAVVDTRGVHIVRLDGWSGFRDHLTAYPPLAAVHLAALFRAEHSDDDIGPLIESNIQFGVQFVDALVASGVRHLVTAGTTWQHHNGREGEPTCLYAATKSAFDSLLEYYVAAHELRAVTLHLSDVYGPADPRPKLIPTLLRAARTGERLALSPGEQRLDLLHVSDAVRAFARALSLLREGHSLDRHYRASTGRTVSLREVVALAEHAFVGRVNVQWGARPYRSREIMTPWEGGETLPGWQVLVSLEEGLRDVFAHPE